MLRFLCGCCLVVSLNLGMSEISQGQDQTSSGSSTSKSSLTERKEGGPIVITGDSFEGDINKKIITYTGNVKVVQGETSMFSDKLVIYLDQAGSNLEKAVATGNVRLVNNELTATGDEGIFYNKDQKLELINNAKVWQGNNTITAHTVIVFLALEILEGYGSEETERAVMTVYSKGESLNENLESDTPKEGDASEEERTSPIVIVSDELKLDNPAQQATFTGDVIATQDLTEINSDRMIVYITQTEETGDDIDKIEVFGNVRIQKETTTVTGETGLYRNKEQHAVVEGTEKKKARVVDSVQNLVLEAPVIEIFLATNTVKARGAESEIGGSRIRSEFGTDGNRSLFESPQTTPTPEKKTDQDRPSVIVYPGKTQ